MTFQAAFAAVIPPSRLTRSLVGVPARIRVRLAEALPEVTVRGYDLQIFEASAASRRRLASQPDRESEWELRCESGRVRAISSRGQSLDLAGPVSVVSRGGVIRFRGRPYREELRINPLGSLCEAVNVLDIEKYLAGLVNAEFSSHWSEQAVLAQVIAARTYAYFQIRSAESGSHFDVDATVKDQVYDGYVSEDFQAARAVDKTRGVILTANGREPIKAFYHSSCAGHTELPENVFGDHFAGFKRSVACPFCAYSTKIGWDTEIRQKDLASIALSRTTSDGALLGWPQSWRSVLHEGSLTELRAKSWDGTGHLARLVMGWFWRGRIVELPISAVRFREWLGAAKVKSTAFQIQPSGWGNAAGWKISGRGNGHGVGMCQLGAKYLGERGYAAASILKHYYPDANLAKLW